MSVDTTALKNYLGIDYADAMVEARLIAVSSAASAYLAGAIGASYDASDARAQELLVIIAGDMYDNRGASEKVSAATKAIVRSMVQQLRIEYVEPVVADGV